MALSYRLQTYPDSSTGFVASWATQSKAPASVVSVSGHVTLLWSRSRVGRLGLDTQFHYGAGSTRLDLNQQNSASEADTVAITSLVVVLSFQGCHHASCLTRSGTRCLESCPGSSVPPPGIAPGRKKHRVTAGSASLAVYEGKYLCELWCGLRPLGSHFHH